MKALFVTGTDTGVGKTVLSGLLGRYLLNKGYRVITQKWIQTGGNKFPVDIATHLRFMKTNIKELRRYRHFVSVYSFKFAASPHLASRLERKTINVNRIKRSFRFLAERFDFVIVEGIGGLLVPIKKTKLVIDIVKELRLPVVVVVNNKLGAINHTLLTIEALRRRKMNIIGIIFNTKERNVDKAIRLDNPQIIKAFTGETILGILPHAMNEEALYKKFIPIGDGIVAVLNRKG